VVVIVVCWLACKRKSHIGTPRRFKDTSPGNSRSVEYSILEIADELLRVFLFAWWFDIVYIIILLLGRHGDEVQIGEEWLE
jgi:hypothetical protein